MHGKWQKQVPPLSGRYWTATRQGELAGIQTVAWNDRGELVYAGSSVSKTFGDNRWLGYWWSTPVEEPPTPSAVWLNEH